ncbi:hypothetical protein BSK59_15665 [Paenibacillus odorifer]|uniref:hypothetical protein n=1 Tax=Paenibacillus odorifer TaxID=189426 RepID=UPI00096ECFDD|nr:hypothetical protein [Paenibacillus odorifer]OME54017.1 hypothetical protein BSK59_15665 [Paenibacillus odorifer]
MSEIYETKDNHTYLMTGNRVSAIFIPDDSDAQNESGISGYIYEVVSWIADDTPWEIDFYCHFLIKWDGCSHFRFYGEDYTITNGMESRMEAYYHLCGASSFIQHMRLMAFAYELKVVKCGMSKTLNGEEKDYEAIKALGLLNGYTIVKN